MILWLSSFAALLLGPKSSFKLWVHIMFFLESNGSRAMSPCRHVQLISPGSLNRSRNDSASGAAQVRPWMGMVLKSQEFDDVF